MSKNYSHPSHKKSIVHYALRGISQAIGLSKYELGDELLESMQKNLPTVEQLEMEIESADREFEDSIEG